MRRVALVDRLDPDSALAVERAARHILVELNRAASTMVGQPSAREHDQNAQQREKNQTQSDEDESRNPRVRR